MNETHLKVLGALLAHDECTVRDIQDITGVPRPTIESALTRTTRDGIGRFVERAGERRGGGRPALIWRLRDDTYDTAYELYEDAIAGFRAAAPPPQRTDAAARTAVADGDVRAVIRGHLSAATWTTDPAAAAHDLAKADHWLRYEADRIEDWCGALDPADPVADLMAGDALDPGDAGSGEPLELRKARRELERLQNWRRGFDLGIATTEPFAPASTLDRLADWVTDNMKAWFAGPAIEVVQTPVFAPLALAPAPHRSWRKAVLVDQLWALADASRLLPALRQEDLVMALLMAVPRLGAAGQAEARSAVCTVLDRLGHDHVGNLLLKGAASHRVDHSNTPAAIAHRRFIIHVLCALNSHEGLARAPNVADWLTRLFNEISLWSERYWFFFYRAYVHTAGSQELFLRRHAAALRAHMDAMGDPVWAEETQGLNLDIAMLRQLGAAHLRDAGRPLQADPSGSAVAAIDSGLEHIHALTGPEPVSEGAYA